MSRSRSNECPPGANGPLPADTGRAREGDKCDVELSDYVTIAANWSSLPDREGVRGWEIALRVPRTNVRPDTNRSTLRSL